MQSWGTLPSSREAVLWARQEALRRGRGPMEVEFAAAGMLAELETPSTSPSIGKEMNRAERKKG